MKVAILHPWFLMKGGGEKVVDAWAKLYPAADVYTLFSRDEFLPRSLPSGAVHVSPLNRIPWANRGFHRHLLPLYPWAVENFDLSEYNLVISSCGPAMMGANVHQEALHICYCHTPQRSWWDLYAAHQSQLGEASRFLFTFACSWMRTWEFTAMQRIDSVVANSRYIAQRVQKYFRRRSRVIYPPVAVFDGSPAHAGGEYYLTIGRLEKQKRVDLLICACNKLRRKLLIAGTGKELAYLKSLAGPTVEFLGFVPDEACASLFQNARAFLFAADEDFGIATVEAQGYGRPVVAYGHGGSLETVRADRQPAAGGTGIYFPEQTSDAVAEAVLRFEAQEDRFVPELIQQHARRFDTSVFLRQFGALVDEELQHAQEGDCPGESRHSPLLVSA